MLREIIVKVLSALITAAIIIGGLIIVFLLWDKNIDKHNLSTVEDKISMNVFDTVKIERTYIKDNLNDIVGSEEKIISKTIKSNNNTDLYHKNLNELLKISNPTKLDLLNIEEVQWANDNDKFFTLIFKNVTALPAYRFNLEILDANKSINFEHSKVSSVFYKNPTINANTVFKYPLVSKNELANFLKVNTSKILGIGVEPNIPDNVMDEARIHNGKESFSRVYAYPIVLRYKYNTIFDSEIIVTRGIYIYINNT